MSFIILLNILNLFFVVLVLNREHRETRYPHNSEHKIALKKPPTTLPTVYSCYYLLMP